MRKKQIGVLFGGRSSEHEIAVITALQTVSVLDSTRYDVTLVYIDPKGKWVTGEVLYNRDYYKNPDRYLNDVQEVTLLPKPSPPFQRGVHTLPALKLIRIDLFYCVFHGQYGEDGCVQGLLELAGIPYTGCGVLASALAMDKAVCKKLLSAHDIPVLEDLVVHKDEFRASLSDLRARILNKLSFPLFVKPVHLGSSIGVGKTTSEEGLDVALARVFQLDTQAIIEPCIENLMEINVAVRQSKEGPLISVLEIPIPSKEILTYEDKYSRGGKGKGDTLQKEGMASLTRVIDPIELDRSIEKQVKEYACRVSQLLDIKGISRLDFMLDLESNRLFFNELNPCPGSLAFYLWEKSPPYLTFTEILSQEIENRVNAPSD